MEQCGNVAKSIHCG